MGCNTILRLKGHITPEQIVDYIDKHYDFKRKSIREYYAKLLDESAIKERYDDSNKCKVTMGFIDFHDDNDKWISMNYYYCNVNIYDNLDHCLKFGIEDMAKSETTELTMCCFFDNSVEIMKGIAQEFGGWLDEDDCDDEPPYWIDKVDKPRYCWSYDGERYIGDYKTEQEAIEDAKECVEDTCEKVYVGTCEVPNLYWCDIAEDIIQSIYDNLYEECGEVSESFEITREQEQELANRIDKCVEQWIKDMKIKPNCWTVVNEHLVKLR